MNFAFSLPGLRLPPLVRRVLGVAATVGAALAGLRAEEANPGPVVELPKFVVTDSRDLPPPEPWRYATIPGFEILSNASDRATQRLMYDFEMFRMALSYVWPLPNRPASPTTLIICGKGGKFDAFVPAASDSDVAMTRASVFLKSGDRTAIAIDFQASVLNILALDTDTAASGTDSGRIEVDHNKQLYREYVHYLLSKTEPRLPAWFEEGMAQIIMAMKVDRKFIEFGKLEDPNTVSIAQANAAEANAAAAAEDPDAAPVAAGAPVEDRDFNAALQRRRLIPLDRFFAVKHGAPETVNPLGNNVWAKQAYAFVHMCLYGENGKYQKQFTKFLVRATSEPVTEALFKECFRTPLKNGGFKEMSYSDMLLAMRGYIQFTVYKSQEYSAKKGSEGLPRPAPLVLRDATESEVGRLKGEALALAGKKDLARAALIAPYIRGERDPYLLAALGLHERAAGQDERARKFLEAATAAKVVRPDAYLELARYRFADALAKPAAEDRFSAAQTAAVVGPLLAARRQAPPLSGLYELLAETWLRSAVEPKKEEVALLIDGARLFPGRMKLIYMTAALCHQVGLNDAAHSLTDHGLKFSPDAATRSRFEAFKKSLPPLPPASATPAVPAAPPAK